MAPDEKQPKFRLKQDVAVMAHVEKLFKFDRLDPIDRYASHFHLDPDKVFTDTSFDTLFYFLEKWKTEAEFNDRYSYIWHEISTASQTKK